MFHLSVLALVVVSFSCSRIKLPTKNLTECLSSARTDFQEEVRCVEVHSVHTRASGRLGRAAGSLDKCLDTNNFLMSVEALSSCPEEQSRDANPASRDLYVNCQLNHTLDTHLEAPFVLGEETGLLRTRGAVVSGREHQWSFALINCCPFVLCPSCSIMKLF